MNCQNCNISAASLSHQQAHNYRKNCKNIRGGDILVCVYCKRQFEESENLHKKIVESKSPFRLIIGGPGTGKSFLFRSIIEVLPEGSKILAITFINNLVDDLKRELSQISNRDVDVKTLHGFCKGFLLGNIHPFSYFPQLPKLVEEDAAFLGISFSEKTANHEIANLESDASNLRFYLSRAQYYNGVSHNDAAYRVYSYFKENEKKIPKYTLVIVDEYQDFNRLEANVIRLLAKNNNIVVSGDDDQALYRFKSASPEFIRNLDKDQSIEHHYLTFCRRCTLALVKATDTFIRNARRAGLLENRIPKRFMCYWPDKFDDCRKNPKIILGNCSTDTVAARYIKKTILETVKREQIQPSEKNEPKFLIIGPSRRRHYLQKAYKTLVREDGMDPSIYEIEYRKEREVIAINDGYQLIRVDSNSNLGWRIVLYCDHLGSDRDEQIVRESLNGKKIVELLPQEYINTHLEKAKRISSEEEKGAEKEADRKIRIRLTSYLGAKGLSANHVFVLGLENGTLPENPYNVTDDEACQFIVLLTRARKSLSLLACKPFNKKCRVRTENLSIFVSMIPQELLEINENIRASDVRK